MFYKKGVLRNFTKLTGKHLCQSLFLNNVAGLRFAFLLKERPWHRCFSVNFLKFLRTPLLQNINGRLLLVFKNFVNSIRKHLCLSLLACNSVKKRLQYSCFSVKFTKFQRTPVFRGKLQWLLLRFNFCFQRCTGQKPMRLSPIHTRLS